jgi:hypothetical protein
MSSVRAGSRARGLIGVLLAVGLVVAVLAPGAASAMPRSFTFDSGNDGFDAYQPPAQIPAAWGADFGNGNGGIRITDVKRETGCPAPPSAMCNYAYFFSPSVPAGSYSANYGGTWSVDINSSAAPTPGHLLELNFCCAGDAEVRRLLTVPGAGWQHLSTPITEAGWDYCPDGPNTFPDTGCTPADQTQFKTVLAAATFADMSPDVNSGLGETYSLDNWALTDAPPASPPAPTKRKRCKHKKKHHKAAAAKHKKCKKKRKR